jgi:hypothetical protein
MLFSPMSTCQSIDFLEKEYCENEDFKSKGLPEPHIRSQNLICRKGSWEWHVKITFRGTMIREDSIEGFIAAQKKRKVRREQFTQFIKSIDFSSLHFPTPPPITTRSGRTTRPNKRWE